MNAVPVFVLLIFVMFIVLFAGGMIGDADLTPVNSSQLAGEQVSAPLSGNRSSAASQPSGVCGAVYTVRSGDTLFRIAQSCGITLDELLAANRDITNPNLIHADQKIRMPNAPISAPTAAPTAKPKAANASTPVPAAPAPTKAEAPSQAQTSFRPGDTFEVDLHGLPPNTEVNIGLGPQLKQAASVQVARTDAGGNLKTKLTIPGAARTGETWIATAWLPNNPTVRVTSDPFVISK